MNEIPTKSNLEPHFDFKERESELYSLWERLGCFKVENSENKSAPVFNIAMPPPNANGELHLGHAYGYTVMDILGRFHRLLGHRVLLLPGKDHAGIQTQVVFEKKLKTDGVDISKRSTESLFKECYEFCIDRAQYMRAQEKVLGLSADWDKELFTLDPRLSKIVFETFERMWNDGLIYRGSRIVNWSVFSQTAISDVEVEYKEQDGSLWYLCYPFVDSVGSKGAVIKLPNGNEFKIGSPGIVTATTRPETMLGDTALAVHPDDARYKAYIGKKVRVPLADRIIEIISDERIDPSFGTGVVKVTPAHDFSDYEVGVAHNLAVIQVIGKDGRMTAEAGSDYQGLSTKDCREKVVRRLEESNLLLDTATIKHKVPIGERGKDIIEPLISEQWFVNVDKPGKSLKGNALNLVRSGRINVFPSRFQVLFEQWLENLRDWNISRQLWWGHRLPVWYKGEETYVGVNPPKGDGWIQDPDVFDTWFSSGQWAFSTAAACNLVDLDNPKSDKTFFPTHTMVMGRDILFFWACRMLLLTAYRVEDVPWRNIFFTGLIRDEHGQKMSKSKGNGIDPNETVAKYGADSLRLALVMGASPGNDIALSERKIEGYSKFINKLWNAAKLIEMKMGSSASSEYASLPTVSLQATRWIVGELQSVQALMTSKLSAFEISIAADEIYNFTWSVFCDWYLEMMKVLIDKGDARTQVEVRACTVFCFRSILKMLHPFVPFVTEEIFQKLPFVKDCDVLAGGKWSSQAVTISKDSGEIHAAMDVIGAVRSVKAALAIPHKKIRIALERNFNDELVLLIGELSKVEFCKASEIQSEKALRKPFLGGVVVCEVDGKENYRKRLEKDAASNRVTIESIEKKLSGAFATQGKPEVVEKERERLAQSKATILELERELSLLD